MKKSIISFVLAAALAVTSLGGFSFLSGTAVTAQAKDTDGTPYDPVGTDETDTVVVIDAGHGGSDSGATGNGYKEKNLTLKIANALKARLEEYAHVKVYLSRTTDTYVGLTDRTAYAASVGADAFVSIHLNSASTSAPNGCEIYYPNNHYDTNAFTVGKTMAQAIQANLKSLGLFDRQIKTRSSANGSTYPDGSLSDYYAVIRTAKLNHIPGIIVEGAFISNASDVKNYLSTDEDLTAMGIADADGIATAFNLVLKSDDDTVYPDEVLLNQASLTGAGNEVSVSWQPAANATEYVVYRKTGGSGTYKEIARTAETSFTDTGASYGSTYYYTVIGRNAGGRSRSYNSTGVSVTTPRHDIAMVSAVDTGLSRVTVTWEKDPDATGYRIYRSTSGGGYKKVATIKKNSSSYTDETAAKNTSYDYTVKAYYKTSYGNAWSTSVKKMATVTTDADPAPVLTGTMAPDGSSVTFNWTASTDPDVTYRLYRKEADGSYSKINDAAAEFTYIDYALTPGTSYLYKLRAYRKSVHSPYTKTYWSGFSNEVTISIPGSPVTADPGTTTDGTTDSTQSAQAIVSTSVSPAKQVAGAQISWRSAYTLLKASTDSTNYDADTLDYVTPASETSLTLHWYPVEGVSGYQVIDTAGKRVASVRGDDANEITVTGLSQRTTYTYRVRAFISSGGKNYFGPASTAASGTTAYAILGSSSTTPDQMARFYTTTAAKRGTSYPTAIYAQYGASTIEEFTQIVYDEAVMAGVKAEVLFAQICNETGFLSFGGAVGPAQCNFGGIGALDGGSSGMDFVAYASNYYSALGYATPEAAAADAVRVGVRAQAFHLSLYAAADGSIPAYTKVPTVNGWPSTSSIAIPDPRATTAIAGTAPYVEWLGIKDNHYTTGEAGTRIAVSRGWATMNNYGYTLINSYILPLLSA